MNCSHAHKLNVNNNYHYIMGLFKQRRTIAKAPVSASVNSLEEMTNCGLACMSYCKRQQS